MVVQVISLNSGEKNQEVRISNPRKAFSGESTGRFDVWGQKEKHSVKREMDEVLALGLE